MAGKGNDYHAGFVGFGTDACKFTEAEPQKRWSTDIRRPYKVRGMRADAWLCKYKGQGAF
ncbi:MAG: hypothetical protein HFI84_10390 [Eubacterium sp.]|nr:hypothetical protein [Eubacterium sp.]